VIRCEARAVASLEARIDGNFARAAELILQLPAGGRVVLTGMGKAGLMAQKIAATFASTGTLALFMHPAEAVHGDLGMVATKDVVLAVSNSGETEELLRLLPTLKRIHCRIIAITAARASSLGRNADVVLEIGKLQEPCPLRVAPSASTTAMLAMGDALALTVLKARGFTQEDFALLHPAGTLGRSLTRVVECMRTGGRLAVVEPKTVIAQALGLMAKTRNGAAIVAGADGTLCGIFTHGDFGRLALLHPQAISDPVSKHMTSPCKFIRDDALVMDAYEMMHEKFNALPVVDSNMKVCGLLDIQDLV
jgi:arabinose-5-phosphate isomerase